MLLLSAKETALLNKMWLDRLTKQQNAHSDIELTVVGRTDAMKRSHTLLFSICIKPSCTRSNENPGYVTNHVTCIAALLFASEPRETVKRSRD